MPANSSAHQLTPLASAIVIGAGSWGTTLASMLAMRGLNVQFWGRDEALMTEIQSTRRNQRYLPHLPLPENVVATHRLDALKPADLVVFVVPSKAMRHTAGLVKESDVLRGTEILMSCTKGIELDSSEPMSEVIGDVLPGHALAAMSGPNHAEEIALQMPAAAVVAAADPLIALQLQSCFMLPSFRCYTSDDVLGVEWAGAMKNVYAIAAGITRGLQLGDNAIASLLTRGLAEMVRLGVSVGGRPETFYGLSGVGDLMATCYSEHSRNNRVGKLLGQGKSLAEIIASTRMVAEGVPNTESLWHCSQKHKVRMPILDEIYQVLYHEKAPKDALRELLGRNPRPEVG